MQKIVILVVNGSNDNMLQLVDTYCIFGHGRCGSLDITGSAQCCRSVMPLIPPGHLDTVDVLLKDPQSP